MRILGAFLIFTIFFSLSFKNLSTHCFEKPAACSERLSSPCHDSSKNAGHQGHCSDHCAHAATALINEPHYSLLIVAESLVVHVPLIYSKTYLEAPFRPPVA